jgi:hypothetical protein
LSLSPDANPKRILGLLSNVHHKEFIPGVSSLCLKEKNIFILKDTKTPEESEHTGANPPAFITIRLCISLNIFLYS